jgi:hypothetical protein
MGPVVEACRIRDWGLWEALDAFTSGFTAASARELTGGGDGRYYVRQAAVENVIAERMRVRATIGVHRALAGGVAAVEVAHVLGVSVEELSGRWRQWAEGQRRLRHRYPGLGIGQAEYQQAAVGFDGAGLLGGGDDFGHFPSCSCPAASAQIGSPRP